MNYTEVTFTIQPHSEAVSDVLIDELGQIGYESFSYTENGFLAYIPSSEFREEAIGKLETPQYFREEYQITTDVREIEDQDWNKVW